MKNVIKKNSKLIIAFSLGFILSIGTVFAASKLYASKVSVDTTSMPALGDESNVEEALTYLYQRAADAGLTGTGNHVIIPSVFNNIYETYLDPTNLSKKCTAADVVSTPGTKTGCMKWYIFNQTDTNYSMLLDHNTHESVVSGQIVTTLDTLASSWDNRIVVTMPSIYMYIWTDYVWTTPASNSNLLYNGSFHYASWAYDNLKNCTTYKVCRTDGGSSSIGYWLNYNGSSGTYNYNNAQGSQAADNTGTLATVGIRPVIVVSKAVF